MAITVVLTFGHDDDLHIKLDDGLEGAVAYVQSHITAGRVQEEEGMRGKPVVVAWSQVRHARFKEGSGD